MAIIKKIFLVSFILALTSIFPILSSAQIIQTVVSLTGNVTNAVTRQPVTVFIKLLDENGKRISGTRSNAAENGLYFLTGLKPGKTYFVVISQKEYFDEKFEINVPNTRKYQEISKDFLVIPLEKGIQVPLAVPPFELKKSRIRVGAPELLDGTIETLKNNERVKFKILCYPDDNNDKAENEKMTNERCKSLSNLLINNGIKAERISFEGYETTDPKNPPPTEKRAKGKRYIGTTYIQVENF